MVAFSFGEKDYLGYCPIFFDKWLATSGIVVGLENPHLYSSEYAAGFS
jgi:hypothetical protein